MSKRIVACSVAVIVSLATALWPQSLRTSEQAQLKMAGYEDCRATPYYCPAGALTVGIGSTENVENRIYTQQEIAERWKNDVLHAENCINKSFNGKAAPQRVFESMTDAAFNLGCTGLGWYKNSKGLLVRTTLWKSAQVRNWMGVCQHLTDFVNGGGVRLEGLVKRREAFKAWCLSAPELQGEK